MDSDKVLNCTHKYSLAHQVAGPVHSVGTVDSNQEIWNIAAYHRRTSQSGGQRVEIVSFEAKLSAMTRREQSV